MQPGAPDLLAILVSVVLEQIHMARDGNSIDQFLIKSNMYMLEGLYSSDQEMEEEKLYLTSFEETFLETSAAFYRTESERLLKESDV